MAHPLHLEPLPASSADVAFNLEIITTYVVALGNAAAAAPIGPLGAGVRFGAMVFAFSGTISSISCT
jgi:hypothetical protein